MYSLLPRPEGEDDGDDRDDEDEAGDDDDSDLGFPHDVLGLYPYPCGRLRHGDQLHAVHLEQGVDGLCVLLHSPGGVDG